MIRRLEGIIIAPLLVLSVSCASSSTVTEYHPALECTEEGCDSSVKSYQESWGPVKLNGAITVGNYENLLSWWSEVENAISQASEKVSADYQDKKCQVNCDETLEKFETVSLSTDLSINGTSDNTVDCGAPFFVEGNMTGRSLTCELALAAAATKIDALLADMDEECKERDPSCSLSSVTAEFSNSESPIDFEKNEQLASCTVSVTVQVKAECTQSDGTVPTSNNLSASGSVTLQQQCQEPAACEFEDITWSDRGIMN